jgi:hypothetical protein
MNEKLNAGWDYGRNSSVETLYTRVELEALVRVQKRAEVKLKQELQEAEEYIDTLTDSLKARNRITDDLREEIQTLQHTLLLLEYLSE